MIAGRATWPETIAVMRLMGQQQQGNGASNRSYGEKREGNGASNQSNAEKRDASNQSNGEKREGDQAKKQHCREKTGSDRKGLIENTEELLKELEYCEQLGNSIRVDSQNDPKVSSRKQTKTLGSSRIARNTRSKTRHVQ